VVVNASTSIEERTTRERERETNVQRSLMMIVITTILAKKNKGRLPLGAEEKKTSN
jgi:hypothetical protein